MQHKLEMQIPSLNIERADARFTVKVNGAMLGQACLSKGGIVWFPANHHYGYKLSWATFATLAVDNSEGRERRKS